MDRLIDTQRDMMVAKEQIDKVIQEAIGKRIAIRGQYPYEPEGILKAFDGTRVLIDDNVSTFVIYIGPQMYIKIIEEDQTRKG